jgi:hypothetical protein
MLLDDAVKEEADKAIYDRVHLVSRKRRLPFMLGVDSCPPSRAIVLYTTLLEAI